MDVSIWFWAVFLLFIAGMLALDLGVFNRDAHAISLREAAIWSGVWVSLALLFNLGLYLWAGSGPALEFLTGYVVEKSLAVDNIFVFVLIFTAFIVPPVLQHRVLFWGIIGALALRGALILSGAYLVKNFHWILYVFGAFLLLTGIKLYRDRHEQHVEVEGNIALLVLRRFMPVASEYQSTSLFVQRAGRLMATPLFAVIVVVMITDVVFAVDSIPAIFAISQKPFIVFTSNVFAVLGLRSMYFLLADVVRRFAYLRHGLSVILVFIGAKMMLIDVYKVPTPASLGVIAAIFGVSILLSLRSERATSHVPGAVVENRAAD